MIDRPIVNAIQNKLFACTALTAIVGTNIAYAQGPIVGTWPQVHFFKVSSIDGYKVDFNYYTAQFSTWALDKWDAITINDIVYAEFNRFIGKVSASPTVGDVDITWSEMIDSGALPEADTTLHGQYVRFKFRYRGANLGGL